MDAIINNLINTPIASTATATAAVRYDSTTTLIPNPAPSVADTLLSALRTIIKEETSSVPATTTSLNYEDMQNIIDHVVDSLDYVNLAENLNLTSPQIREMARNIDTSALAYDIDYSSLSEGIDYSLLASEFEADDIADHIDTDEIVSNVTREVIEKIDTEEIASNIDYASLAYEISLSDLSEEFNHSDIVSAVVNKVSTEDIAESIDTEDVAQYVPLDALARELINQLRGDPELVRELVFSVARAVAYTTNPAAAVIAPVTANTIATEGA